MNNATPPEDLPDWLKQQLQEMPWHAPSQWYNYRCRSCKHTDWIEDIIVDAFPPTEPGGFPPLDCPECGGDFVCDTAKPAKRSFTKPG